MIVGGGGEKLKFYHSCESKWDTPDIVQNGNVHETSEFIKADRISFFHINS